ncbi:MAG: MOSC domain-containing protein [Microcoleaceae cyanobacterium]
MTMTDGVPYISRLFVYPIKSLDRIEVEEVSVLKSGALKQDREFAIFDESGQFVNSKRNHQIHALRSQFDLATNRITLKRPKADHTATFDLDREREPLEQWLSQYFNFPVQLKQNLEMGFPDDTVSPGPTLISTGTLETVASWYPDLDLEAIRLRFRANIEISGVPAFWEDCLFAQAGQTTDFQLGAVKLAGVNPCQRCIVVTRDSQTGTAYPNFQKTFVVKRQATLPNWTEQSRFNHFYRLAINTRIPISEADKAIRVGDIATLNQS